MTGRTGKKGLVTGGKRRIGRAVAFLASDAAAPITGVSLPVDGRPLAW